MKSLLIVCVIAVFVMPLVSAAEVNPPMIAANATVHQAASPNSVVTIVMPGDLTYGYKTGPGQQVAQTYCLTCHSSAYVSMQPPMDAKHWAKTVTKMRKQFGMQIPDADATKIANYLGSAYGPKVH